MSYATTVTIDRPERIANWRPIGQLILAIPHYIILHTVLNVVASCTAIYAWLSVLFAGRLSPRIAAFHATYVRYRARTFSYIQFLTDKHPPYNYAPSAEDPGDAGISVSISPRLQGKNRLTALFRFVVPFAWLGLLRLLELLTGFEIFDAQLWFVALVFGAVFIPAALYSLVMGVVAVIATTFGALAIIFTGRWPKWLFRLSAGWVRVDARLWAYSMLLTDEYPPFSID